MLPLKSQVLSSKHDAAFGRPPSTRLRFLRFPLSRTSHVTNDYCTAYPRPTCGKLAGEQPRPTLACLLGVTQRITGKLCAYLAPAYHLVSGFARVGITGRRVTDNQIAIRGTNDTGDTRPTRQHTYPGDKRQFGSAKGVGSIFPDGGSIIPSDDVLQPHPRHRCVSSSRLPLSNDTQLSLLVGSQNPTQIGYTLTLFFEQEFTLKFAKTITPSDIALAPFPMGNPSPL